MYKKSVLHMQSCFLLIRPIVVFHRSLALHAILVTYPRRTVGERLDKSRMRMPRCFLKFKDGVNVVSSRRFCLITLVDICRIDFCLPTLNSHRNVIHSSMKIGAAPSISSFQLSYRSLPLANFKVKTILTRVL